MEATGYKFRDARGERGDCLQILKDNGINSIRLRVLSAPRPTGSADTAALRR